VIKLRIEKLGETERKFILEDWNITKIL
jgi:hypothetical protein